MVVTAVCVQRSVLAGNKAAIGGIEVKLVIGESQVDTIEELVFVRTSLFLALRVGRSRKDDAKQRDAQRLLERLLSLKQYFHDDLILSE